MAIASLTHLHAYVVYKSCCFRTQSMPVDEVSDHDLDPTGYVSIYGHLKEAFVHIIKCLKIYPLMLKFLNYLKKMWRF